MAWGMKMKNVAGLSNNPLRQCMRLTGDSDMKMKISDMAWWRRRDRQQAGKAA